MPSQYRKIDGKYRLCKVRPHIPSIYDKGSQKSGIGDDPVPGSSQRNTQTERSKSKKPSQTTNTTVQEKDLGRSLPGELSRSVPGA
jgi:hypothetical protein